MSEPNIQSIEDIGVHLIPGRVNGPSDPGACTGPGRALQEAEDAERLGLRTAWISERFDLKEAGSVLGGVSARTTRLRVGTGAVAATSRHPLVMAGFAATMQGISQGRFVLGLGRGGGYTGSAHPFPPLTYNGFADYVSILRRLWAGETVSYDGPAGTFAEMRTPDLLEGDPPEIWAAIMGGPRACAEVACIVDGVQLANYLTPAAVSRAVEILRSTRERAGLDPQRLRICQNIVSAPGFDETKTLNVTAARFLTYVIGWPTFFEAFCRMNEWDAAVLARIQEHPLFSTLDKNADQTFFRHQILDAAALVPESWMRETCAMGTINEAVATLSQFRDCGIDEISLYGSTPRENEEMLYVWRQRR